MKLPHTRTHPYDSGGSHGRIDIAGAFAQVVSLSVVARKLVAYQRRHRLANRLLDKPACIHDRREELDAMVLVGVIALQESLKGSRKRFVLLQNPLVHLKNHDSMHRTEVEMHDENKDVPPRLARPVVV
jgi:hypothetical protein